MNHQFRMNAFFVFCDGWIVGWVVQWMFDDEDFEESEVGCLGKGMGFRLGGYVG